MIYANNRYLKTQKNHGLSVNKGDENGIEHKGKLELCLLVTIDDKLDMATAPNFDKEVLFV